MNFEFVFHILRTVLEAVVEDNCHVALLHNRQNKARIFSS